MYFLELARTRYSVRGYSDRPIEKEKLDYILECGRLAPSATNAQPWKLYVVTRPELRAKIFECYPREWMKNAPVYIVVSVNESLAWVRGYDGRNHAEVDGSIITEHLCLAAADCGLGSCWICAFDPYKCSEILQLPDVVRPIAIIPIGYPLSDTVPEKKRKPLNEIVEFL